MALIEKSGGIEGFVDFMQHRVSLVKSPRSALMLSYIVGVIIFVESSITALIAGAVGKPFCDKYKIPSAKLAFVCDSTSAPISSLIVLNGWGALLLGLISTQITLGVIDANAVDLLIDSIVYNFYAMSALAVTFLSVWYNIDIGAMKNAKHIPKDIKYSSQTKASMFYMLIPIILMIIFVFMFLYITGDGDILKGSGSSSIFYTMLATLIFTFFYFVGSKNMSFATWGKTTIKGAIKLIPIALILLFAFAIGKVTTDLQTGQYLASLVSERLSVYLLAGVIFVLSSIMAFATGTSWGTFSIMIPVAAPMAIAMDADVALCIGAVISGGIFGDHCSPISDTTIISSMASDCEVIEHVKTQLPYALISGVIALALFIVFSFLKQY
ncbi:MAG: sodium:proton antiporter [Sulfurimonas sp.]|uniref:Na+/H+ antiporter NhaC family protein n=1 Tax=Sulfurimonas sp. TaxID=2022749 RepID=UPI00260459E4|nr:Na+/H+ antiporter NhaC family protein [Sulfurimonas sp.]MCW8895737.1 sodium:proton antiporter [Sulfurimonas sp.]MCW8953310.1 sodium:proton antiporter [Sulfurimonas sp.]